ncbi:histidine kinase [Streptomyces sp. NBUA17]|uniref:sensor histidine kinase n=1 Tax=Streptomyces sp. NBUA17 TaxID=3062275 RepID=UPI0037D9FC45
MLSRTAVHRVALRFLKQVRQRARAASARAWIGEGLVIAAVAAIEYHASHRTHSGAEVTLIVVSVVVCLPLRRLIPAGTLLGTSVLSAWSVLPFATPVLAFGSTRRLAAREPAPRRRSTPLLTTATALATFGLSTLHSVLPHGRFSSKLLVYSAGVTLLFVVAPALVGLVVGQRRRLLTVLQERNRHLEQAQRLTETRSRLQERARIAQEMHDLLGHRLTLISLYAGAVEMNTAREAPRLSEECGLVASTARTAMAELRDLLGVLRDDRLVEDGSAAFSSDITGTEDDIRALVEATRRTGLRARLEWTEIGSPSPVVRSALHRLVRESLTNIHKHAPDTSGIVVKIGIGKTAVDVTIRNGPSPHASDKSANRVRLAGTGSGLVALEERVRLLGGTFSAGPDGDGGFTTRARMPLHTQEPLAVSEAAVPAPTRPPRPVAFDGLPDTPAAVEPGGDNTPGTTTDVHPSPIPAPSTADTPAPTEPAAARPAGKAGRPRTLLGCAAALVALLLGLAAIGIWIRTEIDEARSNSAHYAEVKNGMTRDEVRELLGPEPSADSLREMREQEPSRREGQDCLYRLGMDRRVPLAYRFCFDRGHLVDKQTFRLTSR